MAKNLNYKNKSLENVSKTLMVLGGIITVYFFISTWLDDFTIWNKNPIDFTVTGQFGDFVGGVVGTIFALAGTLLIYLSFSQQIRQNRREAFESAYFEMLRLHRENVSEMRYSKYNNGENLDTSENRKVFKVILSEFLDCFREIKRYSNSKDIKDYILPNYVKELENIIATVNPNIDIIELALIDIAFSIVYFGVSREGEIILRHNFKWKYNHSYFYGLLRYIKLKPKKENKERWQKWEKLFAMKFKDFKRVNEEYYNYRKHLSIINLSSETVELLFDKEFSKYYGGHQHRLGHYFRHLFQSYKYLTYHQDLSEEEKYFYGKTLRAQLSTYEQALLFINSISSLGRKWEYTPDPSPNMGNVNKESENSKLITRYNLIKNLAGMRLSNKTAH